DDRHLAGTELHDLEIVVGDIRVRLRQQQRLVRRNLRARDLDGLGCQAAAEVERHEAAGAEQTLKPAIAREKRPLVVLDDHPELERHDTVSNHFFYSPSPHEEWGEGT